MTTQIVLISPSIVAIHLPGFRQFEARISPGPQSVPAQFGEQQVQSRAESELGSLLKPER